MTIAALRAIQDGEFPEVRRLPAPRLNRTPRKEEQVDTQTAVAVSMYKHGETVAAITQATGLTQDQIGAAVTATGVPFVADRYTIRATGPELPPPAKTAAPSTAEALIAWGMGHGSPRVQRLADQARAALADLQQAQRKEAAVTGAEELVRRAEQQLADAKAALRTAKGSSAPATAGTTSDRPTTEECAAIRAWARENGVEVGAVGTPARRVIDAYRAARAAA
jgi:alkaline phosphatase